MLTGKKMKLFTRILGDSNKQKINGGYSADGLDAPDPGIIYSFGSQCDSNYGEVIFRPDGSTYGYHHENENSWGMQNNELCFLSHSGNITSRFRKVAEDIWIGHGENVRWPLYLLPLLKIEENKADKVHVHNAGFLINSIPKAGTYFLEAALKRSGITSLRFHLSALDVVDDYRDLPDAEVHVNPYRTRIKAQIPLLTSLLQGRAVVGHIENVDLLATIRQQGICIFNVRRNLRDVLASLYRFIGDKIEPADLFDHYWRDVSEEKRFLAFMITAVQVNIPFLKEIGRMMVNDADSISLSYEEMCQGVISADAVSKLNTLRPGFAGELQQALKDELGKSNPTFSGKRSSWQDVWSDDAELYFAKCGLLEVNTALGYS